MKLFAEWLSYRLTFCKYNCMKIVKHMYVYYCMSISSKKKKQRRLGPLKSIKNIRLNIHSTDWFLHFRLDLYGPRDGSRLFLCLLSSSTIRDTLEAWGKVTGTFIHNDNFKFIYLDKENSVRKIRNSDQSEILRHNYQPIRL